MRRINVFIAPPLVQCRHGVREQRTGHILESGLLLSTLLKPDGRLNIAPGFSGSVDASGYTMRTGSDGAPIFSPVSPQAAGDERWNPRFGIPGISQSRISAVAVAANGDIYVGGQFKNIHQMTVNNIARWNGTAWSALDRGIGRFDFNGDFDSDATVYTLATKGTQLYVGGKFTVAGPIATNAIAVWNGSSWTALGAITSSTLVVSTRSHSAVPRFLPAVSSHPPVVKRPIISQHGTATAGAPWAWA
jgi:hypothetical protein